MRGEAPNREEGDVYKRQTRVCFVTPDVEFSPGNGRVQFFSTMKALSAAVPANSAAYWAGNAFFSRDDRPKTLAGGRVFTEPTAAELTGGQVALSGLANVTDGAFDIEVNDTLVSVSGLSFDGAPTVAEVAEVLNLSLIHICARRRRSGSGRFHGRRKGWPGVGRWMWTSSPRRSWGGPWAQPSASTWP